MLRSRGSEAPTMFVGAMVIGAIAVSLAIIAGAGLELPIYLLASSFVLMDGLDAALRLWLRYKSRRTGRNRLGSASAPRPFAILCSVHNFEHDIDTLFACLEDYRSAVWIVDDASSDETALRLRASGWRYIALDTNLKKPGAIKTLLQQLPAEISTVLIMDPDVRLPRNLADRIAAFQASGAAAACPMLTIGSDGTLAEFQHIEYTLSFGLGRDSLSPLSVTSGISLYDRQVLEQTLKVHSLSVYGEDLENAVTILASGADIIYDGQLVIETESKCNLHGWFSQRVGWSFSLFKVYAEHTADIFQIIRRSPLGFYQFGIYFGVFSILLWPLKIASLLILAYSFLNGIDELLAFDLIANNRLNHPGFFAACYIKYSAIVCAAYLLVAPRNDVLRGLIFMPLYFFYCIALVVPTTIGYMNWITLRLFNFRIYSDHYDDAPVLGREWQNV